MPVLPPGKKFAGDTHYKDAFSKRNKTRVFQQAGLRPTSAFRRNNPHPHEDFLMPKNLVQKDREEVLRNRVSQAVHVYMDKMVRSGRDPLKEMAQAQRSSSPTQQIGYSRGGNSYKKASKSYGDLPEAYEEEQDEEEEIVVRIPAKVHDKSRTIRYRVVRQPDAPAEKWVSNRGNLPSPAGIKRAHTPPTPPVQSAHRPSSAAVTHQQKHLRSKSVPIMNKGSIAEENVEQDVWEDVEGDNGAEKPVSVSLQRPKTAGTLLARKMMVHPRMKNWIEGATEYEKEVAFNMLKTLNGGEKLPHAEELQQQKVNRAKQAKQGLRASRIPHATHFYVPPSPAPKKPVPDREGKVDATTREWMRQVEQKIDERSATPVHRAYTQKIELRPTVRRQPRPKTLGDYTHENSFFRFSQPGYRRSFVIAPDWVSEGLTRRRALKENPSANQLRYGSA